MNKRSCFVSIAATFEIEGFDQNCDVDRKLEQILKGVEGLSCYAICEHEWIKPEAEWESRTNVI